MVPEFGDTDLVPVTEESPGVPDSHTIRFRPDALFAYVQRCPSVVLAGTADGGDDRPQLLLTLDK